MNRPAFLDVYEEVVGVSRWRTIPSPPVLLTQWSEFIDVCVGGYTGSIYEYENDRSVRDLIQTVLDAPRLAPFSEMATLREQIENSDLRFESACRTDMLLPPEGAPWWRRAVPNVLIGELARDLSDMYGIEVEES